MTETLKKLYFEVQQQKKKKPEWYLTLYKHSFTLYDSCLGSPSKTLQVQICEKKNIQQIKNENPVKVLTTLFLNTLSFFSKTVYYIFTLCVSILGKVRVNV